MKVGTLRWKEINLCVVIVSLLFILKILLIDTHVIDLNNLF